MQITITRRDAGLSQSLKDYIESKLKGLTRHYQNIIDVTVIIDKQGQDHIVEMQLRVARHNLFSKSLSSNMRASIDSSVVKLDKQLIKLKGKVRRKVLTPQEAILSGKVIQRESVPAETVAEDEQPVLTFDKEDSAEEFEERTGT